MLLNDIVPQIVPTQGVNPADYAILDDLVPKGPDTLIARIVQINGVLNQYGYNPILFTFDLLVNKPGKQGAKPARTSRPPQQELPIPSSADRVRSINRLKNWTTTGSFSGALLWDQHWLYFRML
jgi:hypothetical protein